MQEVYKPQCGQKDAKKQPEVKNTHSREQTVFQNYKLLNAKAVLQGPLGLWDSLVRGSLHCLV